MASDFRRMSLYWLNLSPSKYDCMFSFRITTDMNSLKFLKVILPNIKRSSSDFLQLMLRPFNLTIFGVFFSTPTIRSSIVDRYLPSIIDVKEFLWITILKHPSNCCPIRYLANHEQLFIFCMHMISPLYINETQIPTLNLVFYWSKYRLICNMFDRHPKMVSKQDCVFFIRHFTWR